MTFASVAAAVLTAALPLAGAVFFAKWLPRDARKVSFGALAVVLGLGAAAGVGTFIVEKTVLAFADLSIEASKGTNASALLALLLLVAPLDEVGKLASVWPMMLARRLDGPRSGLSFSVVAACGFAAAQTASFVLSGPFSALRVVRAVASLFAHPFCAALWGWALGRRVRQGGRWFGPAWILAVLVHAVYGHIVFGRGPGFLVIALVMLATMGLIAWSALREIAETTGVHLLTLPLNLPEPPSLRAVRGALKRTEQPLHLRWIVAGALVNLGAVITCVVCASIVARKLGIDLSVADEADMRSNVPVFLLGAAVLVAFPISGYLVARASGSHGVLEPAFAAALAIGSAVILLSVTAPAAVIFAIALAPVAFGLACGGAWFGID